MSKCSKPTMVNITPAKQQQVSIVNMTMFSNDSSGALSEELNYWVWRSLAKQNGSLYQISVVSNPVQPPAAFMVKLHRGTTTRAVCVIVWLRLRYKHSWASKRTPQHVLHVTMQSLCVRVRLCSTVCPCPHTYTVCPHTCVLVSFYEGRSRSPFPLLCLPHDKSRCHATAPFDALAQ